MDERRLLSRAEAAKVLGVSLRTLDQLRYERTLREVRLGRRRLIPVDAVEELIRVCAGRK